MTDKDYRNRLAQSLLSESSEDNAVSAVIKNGINPQEIESLLNDSSFTAGLNGKSALFEALGKLSQSILGKSQYLKKYKGFPVDGLLDNRNNRLYISDGAGNGVSAYDTVRGKLLWTTTGDILPHPGGMLLLDGQLIVCERWESSIIILDSETGTLINKYKCPLDDRTFIEPYDIALVQKNKRNQEIWVSDRGAHCIYKFNEKFGLMGKLFSRGMLIEETIWNNTRGNDAEKTLFLEYPESLSAAADIDGTQSIFLWDSGNTRFVVIGTDGQIKREIYPEIEEVSDDRHFRPRLPLKMKVIDTAGGSLIAATDDTNNALIFWDLLGTQILKLNLRETLFGAGRQYESIRLAKSSPADKHFIVTSTGTVRELASAETNLESLIETRLRIEPEDTRWQLSHWASNRDNSPENSLPPENLSANGCVKYLLKEQNILDRSFDYSLYLISTLCIDLENSDRKNQAEDLKKACVERLFELFGKSLHQIVEIAEIDENNLSEFGKALALMDLALFHNKGNNQGQSLKLDTVLEAIREMPHLTRIEGWKLNTLSAALRKIHGDETTDIYKSSGLENILKTTTDNFHEKSRNQIKKLSVSIADKFGDELKDVDWLQKVHSLWLDAETSWQSNSIIAQAAENLGINLNNHLNSPEKIEMPEESVVSILDKNLENIKTLKEENKNTIQVLPGIKAIYERRLELAALRASVLSHTLENETLADKYRESTIELTGTPPWDRYDKIVRETI